MGGVRRLRAGRRPPTGEEDHSVLVVLIETKYHMTGWFLMLKIKKLYFFCVEKHMATILSFLHIKIKRTIYRIYFLKHFSKNMLYEYIQLVS